jgi:hypothetical protein
MFIFKRPAASVFASLCFAALYVLAVNGAPAEPNPLTINRPATESSP